MNVIGTRFAPCAVFLTLVVCGCDGGRKTDYAPLGLVEVTGAVTVDGQPEQGLRVAFYTPEDMTYSVGLTNGAGVYKLAFNSEKSGCTPGKKLVRITRGVTSADDDSVAEDYVPPGSPIPEKYNRKSTLTATVSAESATHDFAIMSK